MTIGETVQETSESQLLLDAATLHVAPLGDDSILQVYEKGWRHISYSKRIIEWQPPAGKLIERASSNRRQAVVVLTGAETIFFELNAAGSLTEVVKRPAGGEICVVDLAPVPNGRQRAPFAAIGALEGGSWVIRIVSLEGPEPGITVSRQALPCKPSSVALITFSKDEEPSSTLYLFVGLTSGCVLRISVDPKTGVLGSDSRTRVVGLKPVSLFKVRVADVPGVACLSSRIFLAYSHLSRPRMTALSTGTVDAIAGFSAEMCPSGFVSVDNETKTMRIFSLDRLGDDFNQKVVNLQYTPRRMAVCGDEVKHLVIVEADCNVTPAPQLQLPQSELDVIAGEGGMAEASEDDIVERKRRLASSREIFGNTRPGSNVWASCVTLLDSESQIIDRIEFDSNEAAFCCAWVNFASEQVLVVGTARDVVMSPRSCSSASLKTYRILDGKLVLVHVTAMKEIPTALCGFKDHLIVGMAGAVRVYDWGRKQLLRKCESRDLPSTVLRIVARGSRLFAADQSESVFLLRFDAAANVISAFADDTTPRWTTCVRTPLTSIFVLLPIVV
jgi:splicing factor 3B subunit 3